MHSHRNHPDQVEQNVERGAQLEHASGVITDRETRRSTPTLCYSVSEIGVFGFCAQCQMSSESRPMGEPESLGKTRVCVEPRLVFSFAWFGSDVA